MGYWRIFLPEGEPGRANKYAAMAVMARVHLFQQEYGQAKTLLDNIINSEEFELVDNYNDNYKATTENNDESLFEIQCSVGDGSGGVNALWVLQRAAHQKGPAARGWGQFQPSVNLFEAYQTDSDGLPVLDAEDREELKIDQGVESSEEFIPTDHPIDPRVDYTLARRGIPYLDWGIHQGKNWIRNQDFGGPFMTNKFMHPKSAEPALTTPGGSHNARNWRAYRYSHVLLWRAEIAVEENELEYARELVNLIRNRAKNSEHVMGRCTTYVFDGRDIEVDWDQPAANYNLEPYPEDAEAFSTQEKARKAVRMEHRLEFALEGHRFFQLRRWGIDDDVLNNFLQDDAEYKSNLEGITYDPEKHDHWPIPQSQLDIQETLSQDPNWK